MGRVRVKPKPIIRSKGTIDLKRISKTDQELIAKRFLPMVERYFENKSVQADFKKWRKRKNNPGV